MLGRHITAIVVLAIVGLAPAGAHAQKRLDSTTLLDLDFYEVGGKTDLGWTLGGGVGQVPGVDGMPLLGFAQLRWGARLRDIAAVRFKSSMDLARSTGGSDDETRPALVGNHRLSALFHLVKPQSRSGVDIGVDAHASHAWGKRRALSPLNIGPGSYTTAGMEVSGAPIHMRKIRGIVATQFPVRVRVDHLTYHSPVSPVRGALTLGVSGGGGWRLYSKYLLKGDVELVGVTFERTTLSLREPLPFMQPSLTTTEFRLADGDLAFGIAGLTIGLQFKMGAAISSLAYGESKTLPSMDYAFSIRGDKGRFELGMKSKPTLSPGGDRLMETWRMELLGGWNVDKHGGDLRFTFDTSTDAMDPGDSRTRLGFQSEVYARVGSAAQLGVYSLASYEPQSAQRAWDPWQARSTWATELGAFLRVRGVK